MNFVLDELKNDNEKDNKLLTTTRSWHTLGTVVKFCW